MKIGVNLFNGVMSGKELVCGVLVFILLVPLRGVDEEFTRGRDMNVAIVSQQRCLNE